MARWSIIGTGTTGSGLNKSFEITLDTDTGKWTAQGDNVGLFFATRSGSYKFVSIPQSGTQLVKAGPSEVAFLNLLKASSPVGATGSARASEAGTEELDFTWKLKSK